MICWRPTSSGCHSSSGEIVVAPGGFVRYFLGIDVGASKTHALIANEVGESIGFGKAQGGNHQTVGYDGLATGLQVSLAQACQMAGIDATQIAGAG